MKWSILCDACFSDSRSRSMMQMILDPVVRIFYFQLKVSSLTVMCREPKQEHIDISIDTAVDRFFR